MSRPRTHPGPLPPTHPSTQRIKLLEGERHALAMEAADMAARARVLRARLETAQGMRAAGGSSDASSTDPCAPGAEGAAAATAAAAAAAASRQREALSARLRTADECFVATELEVAALRSCAEEMSRHNAALRGSLRAAGAASPEASALGALEARLAEAGRALYATRRQQREAQRQMDAACAAGEAEAEAAKQALHAQEAIVRATAHARDAAGANTESLAALASLIACKLRASPSTDAAAGWAHGDSAAAGAFAVSLREGVWLSLATLAELARALPALAPSLRQGLQRHAALAHAAAPTSTSRRPSSGTGAAAALTAAATAAAAAMLTEALPLAAAPPREQALTTTQPPATGPLATLSASSLASAPPLPMLTTTALVHDAGSGSAASSPAASQRGGVGRLQVSLETTRSARGGGGGSGGGSVSRGNTAAVAALTHGSELRIGSAASSTRSHSGRSAGGGSRVDSGGATGAMPRRPTSGASGALSAVRGSARTPDGAATVKHPAGASPVDLAIAGRGCSR